MGYEHWVMAIGLWPLGYGHWVMAIGLWPLSYGYWVMINGPFKKDAQHLYLT